MKKCIVVCLCVMLMCGCRSKRVVVREQYRMEMKDSTSRKETRKVVEVSGRDTTKTESVIEEVMTIHFADSGGVIVVLPDGSVKMAGITTATGSKRGQTRQERGISQKTMTDDVYVESTEKSEGVEAKERTRESRKPPDRGFILVSVIFFFIVAAVTLVWCKIRR